MKGINFMVMHVIDYIQTKYKIDTHNPIFVSDNKYNIPSRVYKNLNKSYIYTFMDWDKNGYDDSHSYINRKFSGNINSADTSVKYMKKLKVKVNIVDDTSDMEVYTMSFTLSGNYDNIKSVNKDYPLL